MSITDKHNILCQERLNINKKHAYSTYKYININEISSKRLKFKLSAPTNYEEYNINDK